MTRRLVAHPSRRDVLVIAAVTRGQTESSLVRGASYVACRAAFLGDGPTEPGSQQEAERCQSIGRTGVSQNCRLCPLWNVRTFGRRPFVRLTNIGKPGWYSRSPLF